MSDESITQAYASLLLSQAEDEINGKLLKLLNDGHSINDLMATIIRDGGKTTTAVMFRKNVKEKDTRTWLSQTAKRHMGQLPAVVGRMSDGDLYCFNVWITIGVL